MDTFSREGPRTGSPRYMQLAEALIGDIERGRYKPGDLLPPEEQIARAYGVSRHTAREGMRRLVDMGLISRRRGVGTCVNAGRAPSRYVASFAAIGDLFQYTKEMKARLITDYWVTADAKLARMLRCKPGTRWVVFETTRFPIGSANSISHTKIYMPSVFSDIKERLRKERKTVYDLLKTDYNEQVAEVVQETEAVSVPPESAALLEVEPYSPGLHVFRRFISRGDRLIFASVSIYPERRFKITTRWRLERETPGQIDDELVMAEI
jgi:DNA-binding GntR family transcriptional regulator